MFKPKSTTKKARALIRGEIAHFYGNQVTNTNRKPIEVMREDADNYNAGRLPREKLSDWQKGTGLVDAGCFRIYHDDQASFLEKIYGKDRVSKWSGTKCHKVYGSLIGREYAALLRKKTKPPKTKKRRKR
ncbi:MAG: hypothetical protein IJS52_03020 [Bacilli bacterium]|nr:hypothetical protein [Bacilli bacterium]